ncbi:MAG: hypothetical protein A3I75_07930 [Deltaproteobacteria bacterium RIFCSPLOWO2_02_FULL_50_16]|nr:MAG: hypothetical protein A3B79_04010 [Deltaproteobacteria bacterium RIFCSPHIGHO2_02_FULL_50_15]OGQ56313.1 MAG: hypothetical protein A3I75_07930 [Deltaproteobacteria bacterium RIFCSPLOWO2_02_FULL_50_16]OGQ65787.1 MAG: hypothetical protein A3F89_00770 [Deltaproteobacteria bacterium RIFCSPLOWO2_12_FULL_50_11]
MLSSDNQDIDSSTGETLGQYLRRERELRKVSLEEISRETKIHINFLAALEIDNYERLPGHVFVRGFLKAYAHFVGLDFNDIMLRYDLQNQAIKNHDTSVSSISFLKWGEKTRYIVAALVAVFLVILAAYLSSQ